MSSIKVREYLRRHVLGLMAIFIAITGTAVAGSGDPSATTSAVSNKQFKKFKRNVNRKLNNLQSQLNTPVTGELTGTFPNLAIRENAVTAGKIAPAAVIGEKIAPAAVTDGKIAANAVSGEKIANDAVTTGKIANAAVSNAKIGNGQITGAKLGPPIIRQSTTLDTTGGVQEIATCLGAERLLGGGGFWNSGIAQDTFLKASLPVAPGTTSWQSQGFNNTADATLDYTGFALCLL